MNSRQTYYLIGNILSCNSSPEHKETLVHCLESSEINWPLFVKIGSSHLVLQTIYCKIIEHKLQAYFPLEILEHLRDILDLNSQRNAEIIEQVININTLLGNHHIVPMYLKGVGNIIDGLYNDPGERIMFDIDFMVPDAQMELSAYVLMGSGYQSVKEYDKDKRNELKHYPRLTKSGARAAVEIHRLPVDYVFSCAFGPQEVWRKRKLVNGRFNCYVMSNEDKMIHNFIHSQLSHKGDLYAKVLMRNLYDLQLLSNIETPDEVFCSLNKYRKQAANYLFVMHKTFNLVGSKSSILKFKTRGYLIRFEINLSTWILNLCTHIAERIFRSYIKLSFSALNDKGLRDSLIKRLFNKKWYVQHLRSYKI